MRKIKDFFKFHLRLVCVIGFILSALIVFYFSADSRIQAVTVSGNYYYTNKEIYALSGLNENSRIWVPDLIIKSRLEKNPLIESASISRNAQNVHIDLKEKFVIGYYVKDGMNYVLTSDGQSVAIEDPAYMKNLIHFPLLADIPEELMKEIAEEFAAYPEYLNADVLEKIAEILPWSESYDPDMVKMVMQDGNVVFSSVDSIHMISQYQAMLTALQGENVCLMLDGDNQAIEKIACDYMYASSEERDANRVNLKKYLEQINIQAIEAEQAKEEESSSQDSGAENENALEQAENTGE